MSATEPIHDLAKIRAALEKPPDLPLIEQPVFTWATSPPPPVLWLLEGLLAQGEAGCLVGRSNSGKGFIILLFMLCVATGRDLFGCKGTCRPMLVILVEMEDSPEELHRRIVRLLMLMNLDPSWTKEDEATFWANLAIMTPNWFNKTSKTAAVIVPTLVKRCNEYARVGSEVGLIVLDTLAALSDGDENDVNAHREFIAALYHLRDACGACVLAVHHIRKPPNNGRPGSITDRLSFDGVRGSSAIVAAMRFILQIEPLTPQDAAKLGLDEEKAIRGGYAILATTKVVSGPKGDWILLEQMEGIGGGFWIVHPRSEFLCAQFRSRTATVPVSQDEAVLLSIADGITDRQTLMRKHWPNLGEQKAENTLKGVLGRLRGPYHRWLESGRSFVLTTDGQQQVQQLRIKRNKNQNNLEPVGSNKYETLDLEGS